MKKKILILTTIIVLIICISIYGHIENKDLQVTYMTIEDKLVPKSFNNYKIVHVSDLHNTEFGQDNEKLIYQIKINKPDIICITGDIIDSRRTNIDVAVNFVSKAIQIAPIYYVTGNHESRINNYNILIKKLRNQGVHLLDNHYSQLKKGTSNINIIGFKDPDFNDRLDTAILYNRSLKNMHIDDNYTILLSHRPEVFDYYVEHQFNLVLSGHAHGGQFRIPLIGGVIAPNQGVFPKYTSGVYSKNKTNMIVSRGLR